jgi:hypothetical protein
LVVDKVVKSEKGKVQVIPTSAQWFGVTYKEDAPTVQASIDTLVAMVIIQLICGLKIVEIIL